MLFVGSVLFFFFPHKKVPLLIQFSVHGFFWEYHNSKEHIWRQVLTNVLEWEQYINWLVHTMSTGTEADLRDLGDLEEKKEKKVYYYITSFFPWLVVQIISRINISVLVYRYVHSYV